MSNDQKAQSNQKNTRVKFIDSKDVFVIQENGYTIFVNANLIRHELGIEYTKKDGTRVTAEQIRKSKIAALEAAHQARLKRVAGRGK
jgi:hypothetical protein